MAETFKFKYFDISQDRCAMKVGTDGVLLGAWAHGGSRILDIGSGTGVIALMMAQRFPQAVVEGVEIDHEAARQSEDNISASPYAARVTVHESSLQAFLPSAPFDSIVTNPPFFVNSLASPSASRNVARHAESLPFSDIFTFAASWLTSTGELSAIVPSECLEPFSAEAFMHGFFLSRQVGVKTVARRPVRRFLLAFGRQRAAEFDGGTVTLTDNGNKRSPWYENIVKDFYIK